MTQKDPTRKRPMKKSKKNRDGNMGFVVQGPSTSEDGANAGVDGYGDNFDAGKLNGEIAHVITSFNVDFDSG